MRITMTGTADVTARDERGKPFVRALHTGQGYDVSDEDGERLVEAGLAAAGDVTVEKAVSGPPEDKSVGLSDSGVEDKQVSADGRLTTSRGNCPTCKREFADVEGHQERQGH